MGGRRAVVFGGNHHNTLGAVRSLSRAGYAVELIMVFRDGDGVDFVSYSKCVCRKHIVGDIEAGVDILRSYPLAATLIPILATGDPIAEALDRNYDALCDRFLISNVRHRQGLLCRAMDKTFMREVALEVGFDAPGERTMRCGDSIPEAMSYPCIVKPKESIDGDKTDIVVCYDAGQLKAALVRPIDYLVQDYIEKDYELNVMGVSLDEGKTVLSPGVIRKIREWPEGMGSSSFSVMVSFQEVGVDFEKVRSYLRKIGYEGVFSIEFVSRNGRNYFLEINLRNDGNSYVSTAFGLNLCAVWANGGPAELPISLRYPFYFMEEHKDFRHILARRISVGKWIADWRKVDCYLTFDRRDPKPSWIRWRRFLLNVLLAAPRRIKRSFS